MRTALALAFGLLIILAGASAIGGASLGVWQPGRGGIDQALHWWNDDTAPAVSIQAPADPVSGTVRLTVQTSDSSAVQLVAAQLGDRPLEPRPAIEIDTRALPDGEYRLTVTAEDQSRRRNRGSGNALFRVDNTPPEIQINIDPPVVEQGHTAYIAATSDEAPESLRLAVAGRPVTPTVAGNTAWVVWGIPPAAEPGQSLEIAAQARDATGNQTTITRTLVITEYDFAIERIDAPPEVASALSEDIIRDEGAAFEALVSQVRPEQLWDGSFIEPVDAPLSSRFGTRRAYNVAAPGSHHSGTDYAAWTGTPVYADARGIVALAEHQQVRGNLVVLDHGLGVFSAFFHLNEIAVSEGDRVEQGDLLGYVGTTGLSTGPHLHWEVRVRGIPVNPQEWTQRSFP